jgi:hypothetical protein
MTADLVPPPERGGGAIAARFLRIPAAYYLIGVALGAYFFGWWLNLRPGVFSFDSGYYLSEAESGLISSQKPFLYARFLQLTSLGGKYFQVSVFAQVLLVMLMLWRAFVLALARRVWPGWIAICAVLLANPYFADMVFYVQNDVLYCCAIIAMLLETLNVSRSSRLTRTGLVVIGIAAPMAFGFRDNGLLFLPLWLLLLPLVVTRPQAKRMAATAVVTTALAWCSVVGVRGHDSRDLLYPAVIHETVRLAQPGFRFPLGGRLSGETLSAVGVQRLALAVPLYWPLYWDTIAFGTDGAALGSLPQEQRKAIVASFLRHDLMPNLPSIVGHRVELLWGALWARAEMAGPYDAPANLPPRLLAWKQRSIAASARAGWLGKWNRASVESRHWTWNAAFGALVLLGMSLVALWRRDKAILAMAVLLWIQMAAVMAVAPSAEYRYVFMIYLAPLLLLASPFASRCRTGDPAIAADSPHV